MNKDYLFNIEYFDKTIDGCKYPANTTISAKDFTEARKKAKTELGLKSKDIVQIILDDVII